MHKEDPLADIRHILEEVASERSRSAKTPAIHIHLHAPIVLAPEVLQLILDALKTLT